MALTLALKYRRGLGSINSYLTLFIIKFQVMANGNLVLPPFRAEDYNQEVHAQTYRCIALNPLGKIQSRDVHVRAGTAQVSFFGDRKPDS